MAARGDTLFLIGRNPDKLARLADRLGDAVAGTMQGDLNETTANADRVRRAIDALGGLDVAVVAQGLLGDQVPTERDYAAAELLFQTNLLSAVSVLIPIANLLEEVGAGRIAVLSSVAGERGRPRNYTYGACKGALTIYLQGLRSRLWKRGVGVTTVILGPIDTPMTADHDKNALFSTPQAVARTIVAAIDRGDAEVFAPWYWAPIMRVVRNLPEPIFQRLRFLSGR